MSSECNGRILSIRCFSASPLSLCPFGIVMRLCVNTLLVLQWKKKKTGDKGIDVTPGLAQVTVVGVENMKYYTG